MARNKYPGICYRCGKRVEVGDGHFEKIMGQTKGFRVQHAKCAIEFRGADKPTPPKPTGDE